MSVCVPGGGEGVYDWYKCPYLGGWGRGGGISLTYVSC